jgi:hypothetical protein
MALPILDGNQSATTLSSILTSGEHIPAHTVVSLGTQAITDISGAVSGSVVSISNFPATQTIAGTVTIGAGTAQIGSVTASIGLNLVGPSVRADSGFSLSTRGMMVVGGISTSDVGSDNEYRELKITSTGEALVRGTVTIGNSVTIGSLPAISGTVTANGGDFSAIVGESMPAKAVAIGFYSGDDAGIAQVNDSNRKMPISGTVTLGAGTAQIGSVTASISNSVTIGSLPAISGTVTANLTISATAITSGSFASLTSATLVPGNTARKMATVFNLGAGQLFINAGVTATTLGGGFMVALSSGDFYECDYTTTTLSAIFATAGTASWMSH